MTATYLPLLVFDWDRVIVDTDKYLQAVFAALAKEGLSISTIERLYHETKDHNGYSDVGLAAGAARELSRSVDELLHIVDAQTYRMADFIYPDAIQFLQEVTQAGFGCVVVTAGGEILQTKKILHSALKKHFKDVHIVPVIDAASHKAAILRQLAKKYDRVVFFDDRLSNLLPLKDIKGIVPIWVNRSGADKRAYSQGITIATLAFPLPAQAYN